MRETLPNEPAVDGGLYLSSESARPHFSTGCSLLNHQLGNGYAEGQIILLRGDTGSGKSLLAVEAGANFLAKYPDGLVMYRDREDAFDVGYVQNLGIDPSRFDRNMDLVTVEAITSDVVNILEKQIALKGSAPPVLYIVDSWDALTTEAELKRRSGDATYGMEKSKFGQEFGRRVTAFMAHKHARFTLIVVSQIRLGSVLGTSAVVRKTSGGSWLKFYPSQALDLKTKRAIVATTKGHEREYGRWVEATAIKNRRSGPNMAIMLPLRFNFGVDDLMACVRFLADEGRADLMFDGKTDESRKTKAMLFVGAVRRLTPDKYDAALKVAQGHAHKLFMDIRAMFMPKASKYGPRE